MKFEELLGCSRRSALTSARSRLISMEMLISQIGSIFCQPPRHVQPGLGREARLFQGFGAVLFSTTTL